jgi:hypothetical protein
MTGPRNWVDWDAVDQSVAMAGWIKHGLLTGKELLFLPDIMYRNLQKELRDMFQIHEKSIEHAVGKWFSGRYESSIWVYGGEGINYFYEDQLPCYSCQRHYTPCSLRDNGKSIHAKTPVKSCPTKSRELFRQ